MLDGNAAVAIETQAAEPTEWLLRAYGEDERDEEAMHYLLGISYTRSRAGQRAGASKAGRKVDDANSEAVPKQRAFLAAHNPIWTWLLEHATTTLLVDPEQRHIVWAWLITSGDVVHAVGCKRTWTEHEPNETPLSVDMVKALLGDRLKKHQVCSLELPQMRTRGDSAIGIDRPQTWSLDPTWLLTRMHGR